MSTFVAFLFTLALLIAITGPVLIGVALSFAVIGNGSRRLWALLFVPIFVSTCLVLWSIASLMRLESTTEILGYAIAYTSAGELIVVAALVRRFKAIKVLNETGLS